IGACKRLAVADLVGSEIGRGGEAAATFDGIGEFARHISAIESRGVGGDTREGARKFGLREAVAGAIGIAVTLKDAARFRKLREVLCGGERTGLFGGEHEAFARQA